ncbi:ADP-ribosylglycohydrolase family protein [Flavilitoribacter nigricans]|uniref:ADP-ribosylglycohydrolase n=1 Tax=Flavilitoribacter nigricans (strain ATCC 23147 / DSM 23189 / NBRC 102662 / NCIMB 1420 / SS-2) TaxID=1122177 RepID=A0A2D0N8D9_FLAN2|nr:ADP-ribosylglycohydrolase family protein [Flavilitoribacter nigricans]PHN04658.1 ADP-ribosylglycohydrolase [Flavilitoribacter nigricans DSM 23189 = NBRC 102662]
MHSHPYYFIALLLIVFILPACNDDRAGDDNRTDYSLNAPNWPADTIEEFQLPNGLSREAYYNKLLGSLVGSAIGDAMGAPTEMWHRDDIQVMHGYVDSLDALIREGSPEGPWEVNLPEGGTTDDTRWKYLTGGWLTGYGRHQARLDARDFARLITDHYLEDTQTALDVRSFDPGPLERELRRVTWLQEWAKVAKPYYEEDLDAYSYALNRFYGGEMACAGMLYAPMLGAYYPAHPERAYTEAYRLGIFDLGYARDITGLTAAYVAEAMRPGIPFERITLLSRSTDPLNYFSSRLVGRISYRLFRDAKYIVDEARGLTEADIPADLEMPKNFKRGPLYLAQLQRAYELLDEKLQDIPFHAGEVHLINLTALEFGRGDFGETLEFVTNYGRDNDTVAAVTGAILGAYLGFEALPQDLARTSLQANKELLGISLEDLARDLTEQLYGK